MMKEKDVINYAKRDIKDFTKAKYDFQKFAYWLVVKTFLPIFYKIEITGTENIPKSGKFIMAANHISYFDPFIAWAPFKRPIAYMAKKELFENERLAHLMDRLGSFSVNREKLEVSTIKTVINVFKTNKWLLGIFPQGGIRRNRKLEKINKGFAVVAKQMKTNIIPVGLTGCEEYNWIPFKGKIKIAVGEMISYNQDLDEIIDEWGHKVANLIDYEYIKDTEPPEESSKEKSELNKV